MIPIPCLWTGDVFVPLDRALTVAREEFGDGEIAYLTRHEERSMASLGHYFATLNELWHSLPEEEAERFPTPDHLRRYALMICTGWRDERSIVCASKAEAQRMASVMHPTDAYAIISAAEAVVRVWTAKSQSLRAMGKGDFQKSKDDVLGFVSQMVGVPASLGET